MSDSIRIDQVRSQRNEHISNHRFAGSDASCETNFDHKLRLDPVTAERAENAEQPRLHCLDNLWML